MTGVSRRGYRCAIDEYIYIHAHAIGAPPLVSYGRGASLKRGYSGADRREIEIRSGLPAGRPVAQRGQFRPYKPPVGTVGAKIGIDVGRSVWTTLEEQRANMIPPGVNPFKSPRREIDRDLQTRRAI